MTQSPEIEIFWQAYLSSLAPEAPHPHKYTAWYFGNSAPVADELGALVLAGIKTGTASLFWSYDVEGEVLPQVGDFSIITDFGGRPVCVVETTGLKVVPFNQVDAEHAFLEGEDDRSLAAWREVHWRYFSRECQTIGREPADDMPVVCERFRLVYPAAQ